MDYSWFLSGRYADICTHPFRNSAFYRILSSLCGTGREEKQTKILHGNKDYYYSRIYIPHPFKLQDTDHAYLIISRNIDRFKRYGPDVILSNRRGIPYGAIGNRMQD